jgi:CheY-like chemotaxis protein
VLEICASLNKSMHKIDVQRPSGEVMLDADPVRVVQSLANILGNAIKFTPAPGTISLRVAVDGDKVIFTVKDTGIGLEPEALEQIFDMFAQNNSVQARGRGMGGLGIGLSLAKRFTEMHGGTLTATSDGPGRGSEFVMALPVVIAEKAQPRTARKLGLSVGAHNRQVLVVDDNRDGADMLQRLFEADGFTVQTAYDGQQAVDAVKRARPDIVVMDIGMPGMDGYEAVRQIRLQPDGGDILIIALTGWGQDSAKREAADAGFDHHLVKPVNFDLLRSFLLDA